MKKFEDITENSIFPHEEDKSEVRKVTVDSDSFDLDMNLCRIYEDEEYKSDYDDNEDFTFNEENNKSYSSKSLIELKEEENEINFKDANKIIYSSNKKYPKNRGSYKFLHPGFYLKNPNYQSSNQINIPIPSSNTHLTNSNTSSIKKEAFQKRSESTYFSSYNENITSNYSNYSNSNIGEYIRPNSNIYGSNGQYPYFPNNINQGTSFNQIGSTKFGKRSTISNLNLNSQFQQNMGQFINHPLYGVSDINISNKYQKNQNNNVYRKSLLLNNNQCFYFNLLQNKNQPQMIFQPKPHPPFQNIFPNSNQNLIENEYYSIKDFLLNKKINHIQIICNDKSIEKLLSLIEDKPNDENKNFLLILQTLKNSLADVMSSPIGKIFFMKLATNISKHQRMNLWLSVNECLIKILESEIGFESLLYLLSLMTDLSEQMGVINIIKQNFHSISTHDKGVKLIKKILQSFQSQPCYVYYSFIFESYSVLLNNQNSIEIIKYIIVNSKEKTKTFKYELYSMISSHFKQMLSLKNESLSILTELIMNWKDNFSEKIYNYVFHNSLDLIQSQSSIEFIRKVIEIGKSTKEENVESSYIRLFLINLISSSEDNKEKYDDIISNSYINEFLLEEVIPFLKNKGMITNEEERFILVKLKKSYSNDINV